MMTFYNAKGIRVDDNNLVQGRRYEKTGKKSRNWFSARKKSGQLQTYLMT